MDAQDKALLREVYRHLQGMLVAFKSWLDAKDQT